MELLGYGLGAAIGLMGFVLVLIDIRNLDR